MVMSPVAVLCLGKNSRRGAFGGGGGAFKADRQKMLTHAECGGWLAN